MIASMHERFLVYTGWTTDDHVVMAGSAADRKEVQSLQVEGRDWTALWGKLPKGVEPGAIKALRLYDPQGKQKGIPPAVRELGALEYLSVPSRLAGELGADALPEGVRTLVFEGEDAAALAEGVRLPGVERVIAEGPLTFAADTFSNLRYLDLTLDAKRRMLPVVAKLRGLVQLSIGPAADPSLFEAIAPLAGKLEFLGLSRGSLASLAGIERLEGITNFQANALRKLEDVTPLAGLPRLEEVSFLHCPALRVLDGLLQVKRLRRLYFWDCSDKSKAIRGIVPRLEARKLDALEVV